MHMTGDLEFETETELELLVETARLWFSLGHDDCEGCFRIDAVTGPDEYSAVAEMDDWLNAAAAVFIPYNKRLRVHEQAQGFTDYEEWDFDATPPERYPLLMNAS